MSDDMFSVASLYEAEVSRDRWPIATRRILAGDYLIVSAGGKRLYARPVDTSAPAVYYNGWALTEANEGEPVLAVAIGRIGPEGGEVKRVWATVDAPEEGEQ